MAKRGNYNTKQHDDILGILKKREGEHLNVCDIHDHLISVGTEVGTTTIYRQLERLVDEGIVSKYTMDPGSPACFEYVNPDSHIHHKTCFHLRCEICGRLQHLSCDELQEIGIHLMEDHGFRLDTMRTVFYGICRDCSSEED